MQHSTQVVADAEADVAATGCLYLTLMSRNLLWMTFESYIFGWFWFKRFPQPPPPPPPPLPACVSACFLIKSEKRVVSYSQKKKNQTHTPPSDSTLFYFSFFGHKFQASVQGCKLQVLQLPAPSCQLQLYMQQQQQPFARSLLPDTQLATCNSIICNIYIYLNIYTRFWRT